MVVADNRQEQIRRYLLGKMPEPEALEFETQYFADDDLFEEMTEAENDLIEAFIRGKLTGEEAREFEEGFLTSDSRKANVEFAKVLPRHGLNSPKAAGVMPAAQGKARSAFTLSRLAFAATTAAALVTIAWLAFANLRLQRDVDQLRSQQSELQRQEQVVSRQLVSASNQQTPISAEIQAAAAPAADSVSLILTPGLQRAAEGRKALRISANIHVVRLQLLLERNEYPAYEASIETAGGVKVWHKDGLKAHKVDEVEAVTIVLPVQLFKNVDYLVKLRGATANGHSEDVADYFFAVEKQQ